MKELFVFKALADKAMKDYNVACFCSTCDVNELDCGNCPQADKILETAAGEVECYRRKYTGEVVCAWWERGVYEGYVFGHQVKATCSDDGNVTIEVGSDVSKRDFEDIIAQF